MLVGGLTEIIHLPFLKSAVGIAYVGLSELSSKAFFANRRGIDFSYDFRILSSLLNNTSTELDLMHEPEHL